MQTAPSIVHHALPGARFLAHRPELEAALARVFERGQFILGPETAAFETAFARFLGVPEAVGVASGTDALELALRACGIGPGQGVLTVSWTATATVAAIERAGAIPVLVDIDPDTGTMDPAEVGRVMSEVPRQPGWPAIRALVVVHLYGNPADIPALARLAEVHGLRLIEDCGQAHGAILVGRMAGTWGDAAAFSFYPTKNLGGFGDGGAVVTADAGVAERVRRLREYGWEPRLVSREPGVNSRLDEIQAALLGVLLPHLPAENLRRRQLAARYDAALAGTGLRPFRSPSGAEPVFHQYVIRSRARDVLRAYLEARGVPTQIHYPVPVHQQPAYAHRLPGARGGLPRTEAAAREVLSLPMSPHLTCEEIAPVLDALAAWREPAETNSSSS